MQQAFLSGTTCEYLVHKLGRKGLRITKELLDIATSHALGEETVGTIFDHAKDCATRVVSQLRRCNSFSLNEIHAQVRSRKKYHTLGD